MHVSACVTVYAGPPRGVGLDQNPISGRLAGARTGGATADRQFYVTLLLISQFNIDWTRLWVITIVHPNLATSHQQTPYNCSLKTVGDSSKQAVA